MLNIDTLRKEYTDYMNTTLLTNFEGLYCWDSKDTLRKYFKYNSIEEMEISVASRNRIYWYLPNRGLILHEFQNQLFEEYGRLSSLDVLLISYITNKEIIRSNPHPLDNPRLTFNMGSKSDNIKVIILCIAVIVCCVLAII